MKAVSLVDKLHKTLQWLQNLQFVTEIFCQNGTSFICMNKGPEERVPILFCIKFGTATDLTYRSGLVIQQFGSEGDKEQHCMMDLPFCQQANRDMSSETSVIFMSRKRKNYFHDITW
jgi:hypothetical protein